MVEEVRKLASADEVREALALCRRVFDEFVAPDYGQEGHDTFYRVTDEENNILGWQTGEYAFYGAFFIGRLIGVAASRQSGSHIMLLFVDKAYHRQGVAAKLVMEIIRDASAQNITVNASPYGAAAYQRMGFVRTGAAETAKGMTFIPMEYSK